MKHIGFSFALAAFMIYGVEAQPKLAIDSMTVNLGTMYSGQVKTSRIVLKNIGNQPLKILRIQPSCGCTTVRQPKSELKPNESDEVEVSFNSMLYRGPVEKYVNIETNDPLSQYIAVKLIADVKEELAPTSGSYSLWFGNVPIGKRIEQSIAFTNVSSRSISVQRITSSIPQIAAKPDQMHISPSDTLTVELTALPDKIGYSTGILTILTDSKNQPTVELKVYYIGEDKIK